MRRPVSAGTMLTDPTDEACPGCGDTTGVQPTPGISPRVKAWSCTACQTDWAITVVNPQPYFDRLAATVERLGATRSVLRAVLSDPAVKIMQIEDDQFRSGLIMVGSSGR
jgi:hypothetical protein